MVMGPGGSGEVTKGQEDWARASGRQWLGLDPSRDKTPEKSPEVRPKWGCPHSNPMQHAAAKLTFPMLPAAPPLHPLPNKHNPKFLSCHLQPCPPPAPPPHPYPGQENDSFSPSKLHHPPQLTALLMLFPTLKLLFPDPNCLFKPCLHSFKYWAPTVPSASQKPLKQEKKKKKLNAASTRNSHLVLQFPSCLLKAHGTLYVLHPWSPSFHLGYLLGR